MYVKKCAGRDGWAAPRLKDAALSLDKLRESYLEVCEWLNLFMVSSLPYWEFADIFFVRFFFSVDNSNENIVSEVQTGAWRSQ